MRFTIRNTRDFASAVRSLRRNKEMTQQSLATRAGVSTKWISHVESNKSGLRFTTVLTLLDALDVDLVLQPRPKPALDLDEFLGLKADD